MLDERQQTSNDIHSFGAGATNFPAMAFSPVRRSPLYGDIRNTQPTMITLAELRRLLGGPQALPEGFNERSAGQLALTRLELEPGDVLYKKGSKVVYAYIVESGLVQCTRQSASDDHAPDVVTYVAAHDVLGIHGSPQHRHETACAVTRTSLLALPVNELREMAAHSALLSELIARPRGQALMRDWRTVYRLRDLPPYARTVAGLSHLIRLAWPDGDLLAPQAAQPVNIETATLCRWLGLDAQALDKSLAQLQRYGALSQQNGHISTLVPDVLLQVFSALRPWRHDEAERPSPGGSAGSVMHTLPTAAAMLFASAHAEAAVNSTLGAVGASGLVPWGFVLFSSLILVVSHLRMSRGRRQSSL